jgi:hypothetical protein
MREKTGQKRSKKLAKKIGCLEIRLETPRPVKGTGPGDAGRLGQGNDLVRQPVPCGERTAMATAITADPIEGCPNPDFSHEFSVF